MKPVCDDLPSFESHLHLMRRYCSFSGIVIFGINSRFWRKFGLVAVSFTNQPKQEGTMPTSRHVQAFLVVSTVLITASSAFQTISVVLSRRSFATSLSFSVQEDDARPQQLPSFIQSPVLAKVYPAILAHNQKHGNPNIPLGSENGKRCKTLRRLAFQNKLTSDELEILTEMGFRWNSFEDVYTECDFDEMREKLMAYHDEFDTFQIPKKYEPDPELGVRMSHYMNIFILLFTVCLFLTSSP